MPRFEKGIRGQRPRRPSWQVTVVKAFDPIFYLAHLYQHTIFPSLHARGEFDHGRSNEPFERLRNHLKRNDVEENALHHLASLERNHVMTVNRRLLTTEHPIHKLHKTMAVRVGSVRNAAHRSELTGGGSETRSLNANSDHFP